MVELFFGKRFNFFLFLLVIFFFNNKKSIIISSNNNNDTILKIKFEKEINKQIYLLSDTGFYQMDFLNGTIKFYKDTFFCPQKKHIIVSFVFNKESIIDKYFQVYKIDSNRIVKCIDEKKLCSNNYKIYDYNFDNFNDFSIKWSYCSGRCNGNIYSVYLYDNNLDTFYYKIELDYNTGLYIDTINKSIITEDKCNVTWKKFIWKNFELKQTEEIIFNNEFAYCLNSSNECIREHYLIKDNIKVLKDKKQTCQLPINWYSFILK